jgi:hypothetical protein
VSTVTKHKLTEDVCVSASNLNEKQIQYKACSVYENYVKSGNYK